jgi:hypothetical protein
LSAAGVKLYSSYGTTESGSSTHAFNQTKGDETAWAYMKFGAHTNVRWMPQGDGTYECQFQVSAVYSCLAFEYITKRLVIDFFRHAIHMFWQLKTCQIFGDMQHRIFLLDILRRITFGSCEIPSSSTVYDNLSMDLLLASAV